jgi:hypothetical protein
MRDDEMLDMIVTWEAFVIALLSSRTGWSGTARELVVVFGGDALETRRRLNRMVRGGQLRKGRGGGER